MKTAKTVVYVAAVAAARFVFADFVSYSGQTEQGEYEISTFTQLTNFTEAVRDYSYDPARYYKPSEKRPRCTPFMSMLPVLGGFWYTVGHADMPSVHFCRYCHLRFMRIGGDHQGKIGSATVGDGRGPFIIA